MDKTQKMMVYLFLIVLGIYGVQQVGSTYEETKSHQIDFVYGHALPMNDLKETEHWSSAQSEYIEVSYTGIKTYQIDISTWHNGKIYKNETKVMALELNRYDAIWFEVYPSESQTMEMMIKFITSNGETEIIFPIEDMPYALPESSDSSPKGKITYDSDDTTVLWGCNFSNSPLELNTDPLDAASSSEWSFVITLKPETTDYISQENARWKMCHQNLILRFIPV